MHQTVSRFVRIQQDEGPHARAGAGHDAKVEKAAGAEPRADRAPATARDPRKSDGLDDEARDVFADLGRWLAGRDWE